MKKIIYTFIFLLPLLLFACSNNVDQILDLQTKNSELQTENSELTNQIKNLEEENDKSKSTITELKTEVILLENNLKITEELQTQYSILKTIPLNQPCEILEGYNKLKLIEDKRSNSYYSNLLSQATTSQKILCDKEIKKIADKKKITEFNDWNYGHYLDIFGDKTDKGFIIKSVKGTFSNSATQNSPLGVKMYIDDGDIVKNTPWFRFYEYDRNNPVKGTFSTNEIACKVKDHNGSIFDLKLYQNKGEDFLTISNTFGPYGSTKDIIKDLITNEQFGTFACTESKYSVTKYNFKLDFKYFNNIVKEFKDNK